MDLRLRFVHFPVSMRCWFRIAPLILPPQMLLLPSLIRRFSSFLPFMVCLERPASCQTPSIGYRHQDLGTCNKIRGLSVCANLGVLTPEQYFEFCKTIVDAANDWELRGVFRETIANWLQLNYSKIENAKARKAHPAIMSWLRAENQSFGLSRPSIDRSGSPTPRARKTSKSAGSRPSVSLSRSGSIHKMCHELVMKIENLRFLPTEPTGLEPETAADSKSVASVLQFFWARILTQNPQTFAFRRHGT